MLSEVSWIIRWRRYFPPLFLVLLTASLMTLRAAGLSQWEVDQPGYSGYEPNSPDELLTGSVEPGLFKRAVPVLPTPETSNNILPLFGLQKLQNMPEMYPYRSRREPVVPPFNPVTVYEPPIGLQPRIYRNGLIEFYPWFGVAQSWESNVNQTSTNPISDFYITPRAGGELQIGTPDSIYNEYYDTILALNARYEAWGDLFYNHPGLSAFNQELNLAGRIGRMGAIWRPVFNYSNITGSNLLLAEMVNRTQRIRTDAGILGEYQFTGQLGMNQTFDYFRLFHPDPGYINFDVVKTRQELTWKLTETMTATGWGEYRNTSPDQGFSGSELMYGVGIYGKPDPRIYSELRIGYDSVMMNGYAPGSANPSGLRFNGWTTFDWSERLRLTLRYDRDFVFTEQGVNDNYVSTLLQGKAEIYLGSNWYVTPYFGCSFQQYVLGNAVSLQVRPELEVAYALPSHYYPSDSRIFVKAGYENSSYIQGTGSPIVDTRLSMGFNSKF